MLYPKEDKENRILLYAVSASPLRILRPAPWYPTWSRPTPCAAPTPPGLNSRLSPK